MSTLPILYSFRRCPYAMRARLAIHAAGLAVEIREIVLRDKHPLFLETSPKGTVPVLVAKNRVLEESLDIMHWALAQRDPEGWLNTPADAHDLIDEADGDFKAALDRYKYASRYPEIDTTSERDRAAGFLWRLDHMLDGQSGLYADRIGLADMAIVTFVRQFAFVDRVWFDEMGWNSLRQWLDSFINSGRFSAIMTKYPRWETDDPVTRFPADAA